MHTIHYIAVEAESKEEAFAEVQSALLNEEGSFADWSDWHVVGGGRWNSEGSQYNDSESDVISYAENPEKFKETLDTVVTWRTQYMNDYLTRMDTSKFVSNIVDYISEGIVSDEVRFDMNSWYIKKAADMMSDFYNSDSHLYDLKEYTPTLRYIKERLDKPEQAALQYLVPVDFHF